MTRKRIHDRNVPGADIRQFIRSPRQRGQGLLMAERIAILRLNQQLVLVGACTGSSPGLFCG
jgi:hypothetical protein